MRQKCKIMTVGTKFLVVLLLILSAVMIDGRQNTTTKNTTTEEAEIRQRDETEMRRRQEESIMQRRERDRKRKGFEAVKKTIEANKSEMCNWHEDPLARVRGELCGSYYKVLGIDRKGSIDKPQIKKAYRSLSLSVHPDKNPYVDDAETAFNIAQTAYECLSDVECREEYDRKLVMEEAQLEWDREQLKRTVQAKAIDVLSTGHFYVSVAAEKVYDAGMWAWDKAGDFTIVAFDIEWPAGQFLLISLGVWKGTVLLKLFMLAFFVHNFNIELYKRLSRRPASSHYF